MFNNLEGVGERRSKGLSEAESSKESGHGGGGSEDVERHCSAERSLTRKVGWTRWRVESSVEHLVREVDCNPGS